MAQKHEVLNSRFDGSLTRINCACGWRSWAQSEPGAILEYIDHRLETVPVPRIVLAQEKEEED